MGQAPVAIRRERSARLRAAGENALARDLDGRVGGTARVLVEKKNRGRTEHYAPVVLDRAVPGTVVEAHIESRDGLALTARVIA